VSAIRHMVGTLSERTLLKRGILSIICEAMSWVGKQKNTVPKRGVWRNSRRSPLTTKSEWH
jgi:hypothetical protein